MNYQFISVSIFFLMLFFIDGPGDDATRSFEEFWNLGHIFVFAMWAYLLLTVVKAFERLKFWKQATVLIALTLFIGSSIELIQGRFHRTPSVEDVARDIIGTLAALAFFAPKRVTIGRSIIRLFMVATLILVIGALFPFAGAVTDEYAAWKSFPVLSDFETPLQVSRWECRTGCSIVKGVSPDGGGALKVPLETTLYSGVALTYFPHDWRGYRFLTFNIFNESDEPLMITCRIHDKEHPARGNEYKDRYNKTFNLSPGWNAIKIPLSDVASAPKERKMDMAEIRNVGLFVMELKKEMNVYLDDVALTNL